MYAISRTNASGQYKYTYITESRSPRRRRIFENGDERKEQHICKSCGVPGHSNKSSLRCFNAKQYEGNVELWIQTTQHNAEGDVFETPTEELTMECTICGHLGHRDNNNLRCRRHAIFAKLGGKRDGEEKGIQVWEDLTACLDAQKSGATEDVSDDRLLGIFL